MLIPVMVQKPNQPKSEVYVGMASEDLTPEEVADRVGVPEGCLCDGKILKRKKQKVWSLVAYVRIVRHDDNGLRTCPHCGGNL